MHALKSCLSTPASSVCNGLIIHAGLIRAVAAAAEASRAYALFTHAGLAWEPGEQPSEQLL